MVFTVLLSWYLQYCYHSNDNNNSNNNNNNNHGVTLFFLEIESQSVEPILLFAVKKLVLLVIYPRRLFARFLQPVH